MRHKRRIYAEQDWHRWKYKNITLAVLGIVLAVVLSQIEGLHTLLMHIGRFGYIGAFVAGMFFVSTFTVATSALVLLTLAETMSPIEIGFIAGLGAVAGDLVLFHAVKDNLAFEIEQLFNHFDRKRNLRHLFRTRYFNWMLPVIGAIIIASPLPDELGVSMMGLSKMNTARFIVLSYVLNTLGIFIVVSASIFIKP